MLQVVNRMGATIFTPYLLRTVVMKWLFQKVRNTFEMMRLKVIHLFLKRKGIMDEVLLYQVKTILWMIHRQNCLKNCMTKMVMVRLTTNTKILNILMWLIRDLRMIPRTVAINQEYGNTIQMVNMKIVTVRLTRMIILSLLVNRLLLTRMLKSTLLMMTAQLYWQMIIKYMLMKGTISKRKMMFTKSEQNQK